MSHNLLGRANYATFVALNYVTLCNMVLHCALLGYIVCRLMMHCCSIGLFLKLITADDTTRSSKT